MESKHGINQSFKGDTTFVKYEKISLRSKNIIWEI